MSDESSPLRTVGHGGHERMLSVEESARRYHERKAEALTRGETWLIEAEARGARPRKVRKPEPEKYGPPDPRKGRLPMTR